jgi:hypothetical protein
MRIETNFKIPLVGSVPYFGRIYFKKGDPNIRYRDEMIARRHYRDEAGNPKFYNTSQFNVAEMNKREGDDIATGVKIFGQNLNTNTGGRMVLSVKPPGSSRMNVPVDVAVVNNRMATSILFKGKKIAFDTLKINMNHQSVLRGLQNVQFFAKGRLVATLNP